MKPSAQQTALTFLALAGLFAGGFWVLWELDLEPLFWGGVYGLAGLVAIWFLLPGGRWPRRLNGRSLAATAALWMALTLCGSVWARLPFWLLGLLGFLSCVLGIWWMARDEPTESKIERNGFRAVRLLAVLWVGFIGIVSILELMLWSGHTLFRRAKFEAIVAEVRQTLPPGTTQSTELRIRGHRVWAGYSKAGKLRVVILTNFRNHAGSYGYAYAEDALTPSDFPEGSFPLTSPLGQTPEDAQVDPHWWKVEDHLS